MRKIHLRDSLKISPKHIFYILSFIFVLTFIIQLGVTHSGIGFQLFFNDKDNTFMDFFNIIKVVSGGKPYDSPLFIYPPFTGVVMTIFSSVIPEKTLQQSATLIRSSQFGLVLIILFFIITVYFLVILIISIQKSSIIEKKILIFIVLLSAPFMFQFERGNTIIFALLFLLCFLKMKDSNKAWVQEIALISLAFSAGIKVYPAVFGFLLLRERRWLDVIKALMYGALVMFLPFIFFGGFSVIADLLTTLVNGNTLVYKMGFGYKVDLTNIVRIIGIYYKAKDVDMISLGTTISNLLVLMAIPAVIFVKKSWKAITILTCMTIVTPAFNYFYALVYVLAPLLFFLNNEDYDRRDYIYAVIFAILFCPAHFGMVQKINGISILGYPLTVTNLIQNFACVFLYIVMIFEGYISIFKLIYSKAKILKINNA